MSGYQNQITGRVVAGDWDGDGVDDVGMIYRQSASSTRAQVLEATAPSPGPATRRQVDAGDAACSDATGAPFCTIQAAVDAANNGDTIRVASGDYFEQVGVPKYADAGFNQTLAIQGADAASTFVDGSDSGTVFSVHPGGNLSLSGLTIQHGSGPSGGGLQNYGGVLEVSDSTLSANTAGYGGGIYNDQLGVVMVRNSTFSGNSASVDGGGIYNDYQSVLTVSYSVFSGDPLPGPLADNGGSTPTHALLEGSPAIDAGSDAACPKADQRGVPRPQDDNGDGSAICDIGAYEIGRLLVYLPLVRQ